MLNTSHNQHSHDIEEVESCTECNSPVSDDLTLIKRKIIFYNVRFVSIKTIISRIFAFITVLTFYNYLMDPFFYEKFPEMGQHQELIYLIFFMSTVYFLCSPFTSFFQKYFVNSSEPDLPDYFVIEVLLLLLLLLPPFEVLPNIYSVALLFK